MSRSLAPACIFSRIWLRRSMARGALESASVWFWHTRQRSSDSSAIARASRLAAAAARSFSTPCAAAASAKPMRRTISLCTVQRLHHRYDFLFHDLGREHADALVANHTVLVDHVGLGYAVDTVIDSDAPFRIMDRCVIGIAEPLEP